jgi:regulator of sirC expression with transglutaminase-like and TPR domain
MGNPFGLEGSVVEGVVSARREIEGQEMIQLAMPIEPGNSGGPLVDRAGRVQGLLTLKSLVSANLGFAMPVNDLRKLLAKPNPVPIDRWVTIGGLNPAEWQVSMGGHWSQRAGRIAVEGAGRGFGGRALCLRKTDAPVAPFEIQVWVKLGDESGAAGLTFGSDGTQRCYGFYPSDGRLRLTRFDGGSVYQWSILDEKRTPYYAPGAWNLLKARVEKDKIKCYVNGHLVIESADPALPGSQIGLCKFRETKATFRGFKVGTELADESGAPSDALLKLVDKAVKDLASKSELEIARELQPQADGSRALLMERARQMETQAAQLRRVAVRAHREAVTKELELALAKKDEDQISLFDAALLVSRLDNPELDTDAYRQEMDRMSRELLALLPAGLSETGKLGAIKHYLFEENGFHGNRADYYDRANSYMNDVLDDREGLPITLSVLYLELARRVHLERMVGLPLPGHFVVAYRPVKGTERVIDVFDGGRELGRDEVLAIAGDAVKPEAAGKPFPAATKKEIIVRMLNNLYLAAQQNGEPLDGLHYLDAALAVSPDSAVERLNRARLRVQSGDIEGAKLDYRWFMDHEPPGVDLEAITEIYQSL